jgi:hypothetical protein
MTLVHSKIAIRVLAGTLRGSKSATFSVVLLTNFAPSSAVFITWAERCWGVLDMEEDDIYKM